MANLYSQRDHSDPIWDPKIPNPAYQQYLDKLDMVKAKAKRAILESWRSPANYTDLMSLRQATRSTLSNTEKLDVKISEIELNINEDWRDVQGIKVCKQILLADGRPKESTVNMALALLSKDVVAGEDIRKVLVDHEIDKFKNRTDLAEKKLEDAEDIAKKLEARARIAERKLKDAEDDANKLEARSRLAERKLKDAEDGANKLETRAELAERNLTTAEEEIRTLQARAELAEKNLEDAQNEARQLKARAETLDQQVIQGQADIRSRNQTIIDMRGRANTQLILIGNQYLDIESRKLDIKSLDKDIKTRDQQIMDLKRRIVKLADRKIADQDLRTKHNILKVSHSRLNRTYNTLNTRYRGLQSDHDTLVNSNGILKDQHNDLVKAKDDLDKSHEDLVKAKNDLDNAHKDLIKAKDDLDETHKLTVESLEELKEIHTLLAHTHSNLTGNHLVKSQDYDDLEEAYDSRVKAFNELDESHKALLASHEENKDKLQQVTKQADDIWDDLVAQYDEGQDLTRTIERLKEAQADAVVARWDIHSSMRALEHSLANSRIAEKNLRIRLLRDQSDRNRVLLDLEWSEASLADSRGKEEDLRTQLKTSKEDRTADQFENEKIQEDLNAQIEDLVRSKEFVDSDLAMVRQSLAKSKEDMEMAAQAADDKLRDELVKKDTERKELGEQYTKELTAKDSAHETVVTKLCEDHKATLASSNELAADELKRKESDLINARETALKLKDSELENLRQSHASDLLEAQCHSSSEKEKTLRNMDQLSKSLGRFGFKISDLQKSMDYTKQVLSHFISMAAPYRAPMEVFEQLRDIILEPLIPCTLLDCPAIPVWTISIRCMAGSLPWINKDFQDIVRTPYLAMHLYMAIHTERWLELETCQLINKIMDRISGCRDMVVPKVLTKAIEQFLP